MIAPSKAYLAESALYESPPRALEPLNSNRKHLATASALRALNTDTPSDYIPGLYTLGSTYNVLNGKYADSKSTLQQVVDWSKSGVRTQKFGDREYSVPDVVNYTPNTTAVYSSSYGKTTSEYTKSLSAHAGFEASFPGFSASASADYSESQRENLSNAFTRIAYNVTHYNLSLPPAGQIKGLLKPWFITDLDTTDPIELYKEYGTHLLRSLTIGGDALFLYSTDTRAYSSEMSIEAAAKLSASYLVASGSIDLSAKQKEAMASFNESSQTTVVTNGGDPQYGNEDFLKNVDKWATSILDYPAFVEFGSLPAFVGIWELASTPARRTTLQQAYTQFVKLYTADLSLPGPYLHARLTEATDRNKAASIVVDKAGSYYWVNLPAARSDDWYCISPVVSAGSPNPVIAKELVPGALASVKWAEIYTEPAARGKVTRFWKAIPPTSDYIALGIIAMEGSSASALPSQPPASLAGQFRAVHKRALTGASQGATWLLQTFNGCKLFAIDYRYWFADLEVPVKGDCFVLDPKMAIKDWSGW